MMSSSIQLSGNGKYYIYGMEIFPSFFIVKEMIEKIQELLEKYVSEDLVDWNINNENQNLPVIYGRLYMKTELTEFNIIIHSNKNNSLIKCFIEFNCMCGCRFSFFN